MKRILDVKNLNVYTAEKELVHNVSFSIDNGEVVVILGPNGAGKSSLVRAIACDDYKCSGTIKLFGKNIVDTTTDYRARNDIFLSYQEPVSIPGLSYFEMLRSALEAHGEKVSLRDFNLRLTKCLERLKITAFAAKKDINIGLSGGEKKMLELAQILLLKPKLLLLDEIDSGLDIDSANTASEVIDEYRAKNGAGVVIITHNLRILKKIKADKVFVMRDGVFDEEGGNELIEKIKKSGFRNA